MRTPGARILLYAAPIAKRVARGIRSGKRLFPDTRFARKTFTVIKIIALHYKILTMSSLLLPLRCFHHQIDVYCQIFQPQ